MEKIRVIAIDFDGCLCENRWPEIGLPIEETIERMQSERSLGTKFILWTCRTDELLEAALAWCAERNITFDAVNDQLEELKGIYGNDTRKVFATEYWDDRAVRCPGARSLNEWTAAIHSNAVEHGWWDKERTFGDVVALCHSELSEALEAFRDGEPMVDGICGSCVRDETCDQPHRAGCKPEGIAVEMIDCMIRILDWCGRTGTDVELVLSAKHKYNLTRPYLHGGKAL